MTQTIMNEQPRTDCIYYCHSGQSKGGCMHPNKGTWMHCNTMHMPTFDENSCQPGMYMKRKSIKEEVMKSSTMKFSGDINTKEPEVTNKFYIQLRTTTNGTTIVEAVDENGTDITCGMLIEFKDGRVKKYNSVNPQLGFPLDNDGALIIKGEHD